MTDTETQSFMNDNESDQLHDENYELYRPLSFFLFLLLAFLTLYTYRYPLLRTWDSWGSEHGYNANGLWIFLGSLFLFIWQRKRIAALTKNINYAGLALAILALLWSLAFKRGDINAMQTIGFIGLIWAVSLYLGGWLVAKTTFFPLLLMLFSVQWGLGSSVVSLKMRIMSTRMACGFINVTGKVFGIHVLRQGTNVSMVDMPELAFDVAAACSGLQSLIMTTVMSLLLCYLMLKTWWKRAVMILLIVPIAILNNSLRIVLIAYFGKFFTWIEHLLDLSDGWGARVAFGAFHEYPGLVVYLMGFALVWLTAQFLERLPGVERTLRKERAAAKRARKEEREREEEEDDTEDSTESEEILEEETKPVDYSHYKRMWPHIVAVLLLVAATYFTGDFIKQNIHYTKGIPSMQQHPTLVLGEEGYKVTHLPYITNLPLRIANYRQVRVPVSEEELKQLPDDTEYFRAMYIPEARYAKFVGFFTSVVTSAPMTEAEIRTALSGVIPDSALTNAIGERFVRITEYIQERLQNDRHPLTIDMMSRILMSSFVQSIRDPESIMLAIVQNQTDRHSIHAPEACFPAQGWQIDEPKPVQITLADVPIQAARMDAGFEQLNVRECVLYWYQCEGVDNPIYATSNYPWLPFKTALDLILKGRSDRWAFVRLSTSLDENETYDEACTRLEAFIHDIEPYLIYSN